MTDDVNKASENQNSSENFHCGVVEGFYGRPWTTEQRKDLFEKMKKLGMNTYMYAPKDDFKHRAYWRELYTVEEAEHLTNLIQSAIENGISFFYALSPGLDITYSNQKEVACLKRKLEQVSQFGCTAFALLFDDIEPDISETDKEIFQSFGHAQVSVTNEVFQHLSQPKFLFCPTEYCAGRAIPNVQNSEYLNTVGTKLLPGIDIMWTGKTFFGFH
ncbi:protein O-GlcNAcase-like, partial [Limulus polyphemus]|uniref:Protein O-GlcNAcase-like n=1 Tax=Limulus polyphemus TaxID=6850 RepID=A0ABM1BEX7_LIMPO